MNELFGETIRVPALPIHIFVALACLYIALTLPWLISSRWTSNPEAKEVNEDAGAVKMPEKLPTAEQTAALVRRRRSIFLKDFTGESVDRALVEQMLEAANWAPTHGRTEPWRFVVLGPAAQHAFIDASLQALRDSPDVEGKEKKLAKLEGKRRNVAKVPYMIVICFARQALPDKLNPEWEELAATAAAVQNLHLMATALCVAGYWSSWNPAEARDSAGVKAFLGLGPDDCCIGVFQVGHSRLDPATVRASRGPLAKKVTWRLDD